MPKKARELSAVEVRRIKHSGYHAVGVSPGCIFRLRRPVRAHGFYAPRSAIGAATSAWAATRRSRSLRRASARTHREQIREGIDPVAERQTIQTRLKSKNAKVMTFDEATRKYLESKTREFKNDKHSAQWQATLATYASPVIGKLPVDQIELAHIVEILNDIWTTKTETATRLRGRIENVIAWATVSGYPYLHHHHKCIRQNLGYR